MSAGQRQTGARTPRRWLHRQFGGLPTTVWWLSGGTFANRLGDLVATFLVIYLRRRGFDIGLAGAALTAYGAGSLGAGMLGGWAADAVGRRRTIITSMVTGPLCLLALVLASGPIAICASLAAFGLASNTYKPASMALLVDLVTTEQLPAAIAVSRTAVNAGYAAGGLIGGFAVARGVNLLVGADIATSLAFALVAATKLPSTALEPGRARVRPWRRDPRTRGLALFLTGAFAVNFLVSAIPVALPLHLAASGVAPSIFGAIVALNAVLVMTIEPLLVVALRRVRLAPLLTGGSLVLGIGLTAASLAAGALLPLMLTLIWTGGEMLVVPFASIHISRRASSATGGWHQGLYATTKGAAATIAPVVTAIAFTTGRAALSGLLLAVTALAAMCLATVR